MATKKPSKWEEKLVGQMRDANLPMPEREGRLVPGRRFACDFFWQGPKVICEVEGAVFMAGRHTRGAGFVNDCEKYNTLGLAGWLVLRVTDKHIRDGSALIWIAAALGQRKAIELREVEDDGEEEERRAGA